MKGKEAPAATEEKPAEPVVFDKIGFVSPHFTKAESAIVMALIGLGWKSQIGSRSGFQLLAAVEDKMTTAGAIENSIPGG